MWPSHLRPLRARASPGDAASTNPNHRPRLVTRLTHINGPFSSRAPTDSGTSITPGPAPSLAPASPGGSGSRPWPVLGLALGQFEAALSSAGVTKGGNRQEHAAEKEKEEKEPAKDGASSSKRECGGRRTTHGREAGLLQLRSLASYLLLQSSSARGQAGLKQALPRASQQAPPTDTIGSAG